MTVIANAPTMKVAEGIPAAADVLSGSLNGGGTLLTIPAGRTWRGTIALSATVTAAVGAAATQAAPTVSTAGTGVTPAAGVLAGLTLSTAVTTATSTTGSSQSGHIVIHDVIVVAGSAAATLTLALGGATIARASAIGALVA